jgi:hypothetical protein
MQASPAPSIWLPRRAFVDLLEVTSALVGVRSEIAAWLVANGAADGTMPISPSSRVGRVAVDTDDEGDVILFIVPIDSSMMSAGETR